MRETRESKETRPTNLARSRRQPASTFQWTVVRVLATILWMAWQVVRVTICAFLVLLEPFVRAVLVPLAYLGFFVTLIFGFLIGDPKFPRWGMLGMSAGMLMLYFIYLFVMSLFMTLPGSHDR